MPQGALCESSSLFSYPSRLFIVYLCFYSFALRAFFPLLSILGRVSVTEFYLIVQGKCFQSNQAEKDCETKLLVLALRIYHLQDDQTFLSNKMTACWYKLVLKKLYLIFLFKFVL